MRVCIIILFLLFFIESINADESVFTEILTVNPRIIKSYNEYLEVSNKSREILSDYLPQLSLNYKKYNSKLDKIPDNIDDSYDISELNLELEQILFQFGATKIVESAKYRKLEFLNRLYSEISQVFLETIRLYFLINTMEKEIIFLEENQELLKRVVNITEVKYQNGSVNKLDFLQARTEFMQAKAKLLEARKDLLLVKSQYKNISHIDYRPFTLEVKFMFADSYQKFWDEVLVKNYDVLALNNMLKISKNIVYISKRNFMPELKFFVSNYRSRGGYSFFTGDENENVNNNLGINLSVPLFKSGNNVAKLAQAKNSYDASRNEYDIMLNKLEADAVEIWENIRINKDLVENQKLYLEYAKSLLDTAQNNYNYGKTDLLNLLEAQREYNKANYQLTDIINQGRYYYFKYLYLTGRLSHDFFKIDLDSIYKNL